MTAERFVERVGIVRGTGDEGAVGDDSCRRSQSLRVPVGERAALQEPHGCLTDCGAPFTVAVFEAILADGAAREAPQIPQRRAMDGQRSSIISYIAGRTINVRIVDVINPPITTVASGR